MMGHQATRLLWNFHKLVFPTTVFFLVVFGLGLYLQWSSILTSCPNRRQGCKTVMQEYKIKSGLPKCGKDIIHDLACLDGYDFQDRLIAEKRFIPRDAMLEIEKTESQQRLKRVVVVDERPRRPDPVGIREDAFLRKRCLVSQCMYTTDNSKSSLESADAILFRQLFTIPDFKRPTDQIWAIYLIEAPTYHHPISPNLSAFRHQFNHTATYRRSSTIYAPYGFYRQFPPRITPNQRNYTEGRTKKIAWLVSHCHTHNDRMAYVKELRNYIQVDIFGRCGTTKCPRGKMSDCLKEFQRNYKFYLAFENSNCRDYISRKFFRNALGYDLLPIVMGAHPEDYKKVAPPHSYIHVDDFDSPKALAGYLHKLDNDDVLYNEYFKWKEVGYVDFSENADFYCRFCAHLWAKGKRAWVSDFIDWWEMDDICIGPTTKWPNVTKFRPYDSFRVSD